MAVSHFEQPKRDWSARKHAILKDYLPTFCTALSRRANGAPIWYVDGFAGAGVYRDINNPTDNGSPGSPVLAANITQQLPYDVRCLNVEEDAHNFSSLQRETISFPHVTNIKADLNNVIGKVLGTVKYSPTFFFLDPFGTKDLPMQGLIDQIALRTKQTDILLRYATETIRRLAGIYEKDSVRRNAHAENLDKWFRGNGWRQIVHTYPAGPQRDEELLKYYQEQLTSISGGRLEFAKSYPIRSLDGQTKYHLVFSSGDRLGIKLMSDILFKVEEQYQADREAYAKAQESQYTQLSFISEPQPDPKFIQEQRISVVQDAILQTGSGRKAEWEFYELCCELIINQNWFARLSEKEIRAACKALYAKSKIEKLTAGQAWNKGTRLRIRLNP